MKIYIKIVGFIIAFSCSLFGYSQETTKVQTVQEKSIKPLRVGVRLGVPSILTANVEYVTPLLDNKLALTADYMKYTKDIDDVSISYKNFEIGVNYYFKNTAKGLYTSLTHFSFSSDATFTDVEFDTQTTDGKAKIEFNTINLKLGAKLGRTFYFRIEAGYGFGSIPDQVKVTTTQNGITETTTEEFPEIPGVSDSGVLIFNVGLGFSFL